VRSLLSRWVSARLQARRAIALIAVLLGACAEGPVLSRGRPESVHRPPADEIIIRTDRFAFHMGGRVDEAWLANAERTRAAVGAAVATLLDDEDTTVPILARQLGVEWPTDPLDFDVALLATEDHAALCDARHAGLPRRLDLAWSGEAPGRFFACILARSFARLEGESAMARGMKAATGDRDAGAEVSALYRCFVEVAVAALLVPRTADKEASRAIDAALGATCSREALTWVAHEWVKRVREDESAEAFGARAVKEVGAEAEATAPLKK